MVYSQTEITDLFQQQRAALKSYLYRMVTSEEDAEDLVSETFLRVVRKIESFEERSSIKTWIFTIATNLARDHLRAQKRWPVDAQDQAKRVASRRLLLEDIQDLQRANPAIAFEISEHIDFCFTCMMKTLPLEEQIALMLSNIYSFKTKEIMTILDKSEATVKHLLHQARTTMKEIFAQRCSLVNQKGVCHQCTELNGIFNPRQQSQEELMKLKMVQAAKENSSDQVKLLDLRLDLINGIDPCGGNRAVLHLSHMRMLQAAIKENAPASAARCDPLTSSHRPQ